MRIVIIAGEVPTTTFIDALINAMAEEGLGMVVIGKKTKSYQYHRNVKVVEVPRNKVTQSVFILKKLIASGFKHFRKIYTSKKSLKALFYDLLFYTPIIAASPDRIHFQWSAHIQGKNLLFELFPEKVLVSLRGTHVTYKPIIHPELKDVYKEFFPKVRRFHSVSDTIAENAVAYGADRERIQTIYSYVNDEILQNKISEKAGQELKIISVGRFFGVKGYDYALDALGILKKNDINFSYTIIAPGKIPDSILFQAEQLDLQNNINIINGLPHEEVLQHIEAADVFLLSSVEEGIANVVLEAMAVGTPVISTDCGGMNEVIVDGVNGFLVEIRNSKAIADTLMKFSSLIAEQRFDIAKKAKARIQEYHNSEIFKKHFAAFYQY